MSRRALGHLVGVVLVAALAAVASPATAGPEVEECWDGVWTETGPPGTQEFAFRLALATRGGEARGAFTWRQREVSWNRRSNGRVLGLEMVRGTRRGDRIEVAGHRVTSSELARDRYRIDVHDDGTLTGRSASLENDWTARLRARPVACSGPVPR